MRRAARPAPARPRRDATLWRPHASAPPHELGQVALGWSCALAPCAACKHAQRRRLCRQAPHAWASPTHERAVAGRAPCRGDVTLAQTLEQTLASGPTRARPAAGGDAVVPRARDPAGRQALLHAGRRLVHWLHLRRDDQPAAAVPGRLGARPAPSFRGAGGGVIAHLRRTMCTARDISQLGVPRRCPAAVRVPETKTRLPQCSIATTGAPACWHAPCAAACAAAPAPMPRLPG
jgi:hypothetical protein